MDAHICPSCGEKNNPQFESCWKCHINFTTGGKESPIKPANSSSPGPLPSKNMAKDLLSFRKPYDIAHAEKMLMEIAGIYYVLGLLNFVFFFFGKDISAVLNGVTFLALGFGIGERKSRACAIVASLNALSTLLWTLNIATPNSGSGPSIALWMFVLVFSIRGIQVAYSRHKQIGSKIHLKNTALKSALMLGYAGAFSILFALLYWIFAPASMTAFGQKIVNGLFFAPLFVIMTAAFGGFLPFTKGKPMATCS